MIRPNGWRGIGILFLGVFAVTRGVGYLPSTVPAVLPGGLQLLADGLPWTPLAYGVMWLAAGGCCFVAGFMRRDMWAIAAVMFMLLLVGGSFLASWLLAVFSGEESRDWFTAFAYLGPAGFVFCFSRLVNEPRPHSTMEGL